MTNTSGNNPVTLATIAAHLGVSRSTVSNAYNHPDQLSPALREKILATALDLGYTGPDPVARRLRQRKGRRNRRLVRRISSARLRRLRISSFP